jgi:hypothetical protein
LQWLLICVYNYKLDRYSGNCGGCGLIPAVWFQSWTFCFYVLYY